MSLREHATQMADMMERVRGSSLAWRLLAEHGEENTFTPLPEGEECGQAKGCYENATKRVLLGAEGLTYYEGVVDTGFFPVEHAWAQDAEGRVYELTLRHLDDRCPYCDGEGEVHPTEHWTYDHSTEGDFGYEGPDDPITCERCEGTGKTEPEDRSEVRYLGVPVSREALSASMLENQVYGVLYQDPERVAADLRVC